MRLLPFIFVTLSVLAGTPIDIKNKAYSNEVYLVAIDISANPSNMPNDMLWDPPILLLYKQVESFEGIRADVVREQLQTDFIAGDYQPVVMRAKQFDSLKIHFMNLIGVGHPPSRYVQGRVCKSCKKAYTFSYGEEAETSLYPYLASVHPHGVQYTIDNDGTNIGENTLKRPESYGLVAPGESRVYEYESLDMPGVWPFHDHANPAHSVSRGLHMALVVEPARDHRVDHDFLIIFSDYPNYEAYEDELYTETGIPPFLHMKNGNVMHAHALNGYAAMLAPRAKMSVGQGATKWDAMRTDIIGEPRTPVFEVQLGKLVRFRFLNVGSASSTHSFHVHGHVWVDETTGRYADSIQVPSGGNSEIMFYAGGGPFLKNGRRRSSAKRSGTGDWLYHCHVIPHVKHGMWGIFRVTE